MKVACAGARRVAHRSIGLHNDLVAIFTPSLAMFNMRQRRRAAAARLASKHSEPPRRQGQFGDRVADAALHWLT